jgi:hypothetical protein
MTDETYVLVKPSGWVPGTTVALVGVEVFESESSVGPCALARLTVEGVDEPFTAAVPFANATLDDVREHAIAYAVEELRAALAPHGIELDTSVLDEPARLAAEHEAELRERNGEINAGVCGDVERTLRLLGIPLPKRRDGG